MTNVLASSRTALFTEGNGRPARSALEPSSLSRLGQRGSEEAVLAAKAFRDLQLCRGGGSLLDGLDEGFCRWMLQGMRVDRDKLARHADDPVVEALQVSAGVVQRELRSCLDRCGVRRVCLLRFPTSTPFAAASSGPPGEASSATLTDATARSHTRQRDRRSTRTDRAGDQILGLASGQPPS